MTIKLTVNAIGLETILASLQCRARSIGGYTSRDRAEQEYLYSLVADLDRQATSLIQSATTEEEANA